MGASLQPHSLIWEAQLLLFPSPAPILPILTQRETFLGGVSAKWLKPSSLPWGSLAVPGGPSFLNQPWPHPAQEQQATRKSVGYTNSQPGSQPPCSSGKGENSLPLQTVHLRKISFLCP